MPCNELKATNLYTKKNCWNLDDPTMTFRGPRKARGKRSEVPTTLASPEEATPSSSTTPTPPIVRTPEKKTFTLNNALAKTETIKSPYMTR